MWRTLSTANIKGIGKTVTLAQALFSLLELVVNIRWRSLSFGGETVSSG